MQRRPVTVLAVCLVCVALSGCGGTQSGFPAGLEVGVRADSLAKEIVFRLTQGPSPIPIVASTGGIIESDWLETPGRTSGFLFWKHLWLARVKHHIEITPSFENPAGASLVRVTSDVEERPNADYEWRSGSLELARPAETDLRDRLQDILFGPLR